PNKLIKRRFAASEKNKWLNKYLRKTGTIFNIETYGIILIPAGILLLAAIFIALQLCFILVPAGIFIVVPAGTFIVVPAGIILVPAGIIIVVPAGTFIVVLAGISILVPAGIFILYDWYFYIRKMLKKHPNK
uniref:Uncharacterized protein n=1 Tax=Leptobrachium leishanense TaxID=445787 RepID=A0A8C5R3N1_9ANUR